MSNVAIRVENLGKVYSIGQRQQFKTLREALSGAISVPVERLSNTLLRRTPKKTDEAPGDTIWALDGVSLQVERGEVLGIVGRNGAGKSTLLKILSRITEPTVGRADIHGRVGSLLEVGTGFHPELTGRENIYLNGAILGMKRVEIQRKFDEIVAFAEIEKFMDTPVKRYSSGMYTRLAFAVAAHLEPEILLVDEVLAVGDASFQKKCLGKMGDVAREGRTVLFVSHNMTALQRLCSRAIWLDQGKVVEAGPANRVVSSYLKTTLSTLTEQVWCDPSTAPGNEKVRLHRAVVRTSDGSPIDEATVQTPLEMEFEYWNLRPGAYLNLSLHLLNEEGLTVFNTVPLNEPVWHGRPFPAGLFRSQCFIPDDLLNNGTYRVLLMVVEDQSAGIYVHDNLLVFEVRDLPQLRTFWYGKWDGVVRPTLAWRTELVEALDHSACPGASTVPASSGSA